MEELQTVDEEHFDEVSMNFKWLEGKKQSNSRGHFEVSRAVGRRGMAGVGCCIVQECCVYYSTVQGS